MGLFPGIVKVASLVELFFTNTVGLHYSVGVLIYAILLLGALIYGIYRTQFLRKNIL